MKGGGSALRTPLFSLICSLDECVVDVSCKRNDYPKHDEGERDLDSGPHEAAKLRRSFLAGKLVHRNPQ